MRTCIMTVCRHHGPFDHSDKEVLVSIREKTTRNDREKGFVIPWVVGIVVINESLADQHV